MPIPSRRKICDRRGTRPTRSNGSAGAHATSSIKVPMTKINREAVKDIRSRREGSRPLQELLRPGPGLLAVRPRHGADAPVHRDEVRARSPTIVEANARALQGRLQLRRNDRSLRRAVQGRQGEAAAGQLPQDHRQRGDRLGPGGRGPAQRQGAVPAAAIRSRRPATSCTSWRSCKNFGVRTFQAEDEIAAICAAIGAAFGGAIGVTDASGPGIALKGEAIGLARDDRTAAGHHRRAARRPEHRPADQDRAGRPAAGDVRPQRRMPGAGRSPPAVPADCFDMAH